MAAYKPYANEKPQAKFKKFVLAGIAYEDEEHSRKVLIHAPVDHLKECAKRRHVDVQERMDELVGGMANKAGLMADAIKSITGVSAESPGRKKQRQLTSITANIKLL
jgi:hypothetical protein